MVLTHSLTPTPPQVNMQLYTSREKQQISDLVNTMISYNMSYHQERTSEGSYVYVLDPSVSPTLGTFCIDNTFSLTEMLKRFVDTLICLRGRHLHTVLSSCWQEK